MLNVGAAMKGMEKLLKSPNRTNLVCNHLKTAGLKAIIEVQYPCVAVIGFGRTPIACLKSTATICCCSRIYG
jgi:hypothetical protein